MWGISKVFWYSDSILKPLLTSDDPKGIWSPDINDLSTWLMCQQNIWKLVLLTNQNGGHKPSISNFLCDLYAKFQPQAMKKSSYTMLTNRKQNVLFPPPPAVFDKKKVYLAWSSNIVSSTVSGFPSPKRISVPDFLA